MIKHEGWIKLYRQLLDDPISKKPSYFSVWVHLLLLANHKDQEFMFNNQKQICKRGQVITGRLELAKKTGVSESSVEKILKYLEKEGQVEQQKTNRFRLITINNYNRYQELEQLGIQPSNNRKTTERQPSNTNKNDKNIKNIISKDIISPKFSENSIELKLSFLLWNKILENFPSAKEPDFQKWAAEVDKMLRIDSRTERQIEYLINWTQQDNFWKSNILSPFKLRKHFDSLAIKIKSQMEKQDSNLAIIS